MEGFIFAQRTGSIEGGFPYWDLELSREQLGWLLTGLDFTRLTALPAVDASEFY
jgi:hypothetical protein